MLRRLPVLLAIVAVLAAASYFFLFSAPPPRSLEDAVAPAAAPVPRAAAPTPAPATEPAAAPEPAPERRRPAAAAASAPAAPVEPAPAKALLNIDSDVPGAQVFVDRRFIGAAPVAAADIAPGSHVINVTAPGFEGVSTTVDVSTAPRDVVVKLREVRLNAKAEVVHKHGMGSCSGTLVATPRELRFDTSNKNDAFSAPLTDVESFEVDYLEKNLKIRARGKQYNFTDPQGNADKLFVFHRDVEKARERLRRGDPPAEE